MARTRDVGVCQFVDERHLRSTGENGIEVHLLEPRPAVFHNAARHHFEFVHHGGGVPPVVRLDESHDDIGSAFESSVCLTQHRVRLADAWSGSEIDAQPTAIHPPIVIARRAWVACVITLARVWCHPKPSRARLSWRTLTLGSPMKPRNRPVVMVSTSRLTSIASSPRSAETRAT